MSNGSGVPIPRPLTAGDILARLGLTGMTAGALAVAVSATAFAPLTHPGSAGRLLTSAAANALAWSDSGLSYASGVLAVAGSVPGTPSAGQVLIGGGQIKTAAGISCTSLTASGILNVTHSTNGDNAAYLRNTHASGYGPVFRGGGGGAGIYGALFQKYDGTQLAKLSEAGDWTIPGQIASTKASAAADITGANSSLKLYDSSLGAGLFGMQTSGSPYAFQLQVADATMASRFPLSLNPLGGVVNVGPGGLACSGAITSTATSSVLSALAATTGPKFCVITNDGGQQYFGVESSVAGAFFTGSMAYSAVIYATTPLFLRGSPYVYTGLGQLVVGTTAPLGAEQMRVAGGTMGTPGATDVLIAAGAVSCGSTTPSTSAATGAFVVAGGAGIGGALFGGRDLTIGYNATAGVSTFIEIQSKNGASSSVRSRIHNDATTGLVTITADEGGNGTGARGFAFKNTATALATLINAGDLTVYGDYINIDNAASGLRVNGTKVIGAQGAAVADVATADATDLASAIALANALKASHNTGLARLRAHGLIAT